MACIEDNEPNFKHFCRICKKGFMCGRALGGHMRAHGIGDESGNIEDDEQGSDWEDRVGGQSNRRMYALRTNPNRLKSVRICQNCGKDFLSWKSFLEHGKCSSDDAVSLVSSPSEEEEEDDVGPRGCGWLKRKRTLRTKVGNFSSIFPPSEDEDIALAKCLMALSNGARDFSLDLEAEESCASASKEEDRRNPSITAFLAPLLRSPLPLDKAKGVAKGMFECKACKKVFTSHQALGGHRASHKKVKGCFAARNNQFDETLVDDDVITHEEYFPSKSPSSLHFDQGPATELAGASRRKSKVHRCSICNRTFSSGQALGGHKRCHWLTSNAQETISPSKYHQYHNNQFEHRVPQVQVESKPLDLNLPAPADEMAGIRRDPPRNLLSFEVSTEINLQYSWVDIDGEGRNDKSKCQNLNKGEEEENNKHSNITMQTMDDEVDSKVKLAKLSELKGMSINGSSSPWLKVGIGSTSDVGDQP